MLTIKVEFKESNQRIDKYIRKYLNEAPLSFIYKLFRKKDVKVNSHWVKQDYIIKENDVITIYVTDDQLKDFSKPKELKKTQLKYEIIYEDENILIINKPRGLLVHGDKNEKRLTLSNEVLNYLYFKNEYNPHLNHGFVPGPAHRLDRNTSGIVVFGKNLSSLQELEELFKNKDQIKKVYQCLVVGKVTSSQEINLPLIKDSNTRIVKVGKISNGAKNALTIISPYKVYSEFSLINAELITGRTHQIRVHLSSIGHPIVGDSKYGDFAINKQFKEKYNFENQFLHAYLLEFLKLKGHLSYLSGRKFFASMPQEEIDILDKLS